METDSIHRLKDVKELAAIMRAMPTESRAAKWAYATVAARYAKDGMGMERLNEDIKRWTEQERREIRRNSGPEAARLKGWPEVIITEMERMVTNMKRRGKGVTLSYDFLREGIGFVQTFKDHGYDEEDYHRFVSDYLGITPDDDFGGPNSLLALMPHDIVMDDVTTIIKEERPWFNPRAHQDPTTA